MPLVTDIAIQIGRGGVMSSLRMVGGAILLLLAALKVVGLAVLLWQGSPDRTTEWLTKQSVYAVAFASVGYGLLRPRDTSRDNKAPPSR